MNGLHTDVMTYQNIIGLQEAFCSSVVREFEEDVFRAKYCQNFNHVVLGSVEQHLTQGNVS